MDDGRYANNGWLQELPDPITKLTWDNAALISPAYAKKLGVLTGDLVQITINEKSAGGGQQVKRELVIAALVSPGHAENSVSIPLGYADGWPRALGSGRGASKAAVLIAGKRYPAVGTVCMDAFMVDMGDDSCDVGDEVVLIGSQGKERISADDLASALGTINYEVVTRISSRIPRVYRG